jgi:hypothetical protein
MRLYLEHPAGVSLWEWLSHSTPDN